MAIVLTWASGVLHLCGMSGVCFELKMGLCWICSFWKVYYSPWQYCHPFTLLEKCWCYRHIHGRQWICHESQHSRLERHKNLSFRNCCYLAPVIGPFMGFVTRSIARWLARSIISVATKNQTTSQTKHAATEQKRFYSRYPKILAYIFTVNYALLIYIHTYTWRAHRFILFCTGFTCTFQFHSISEIS